MKRLFAWAVTAVIASTPCWAQAPEKACTKLQGVVLDLEQTFFGYTLPVKIAGVERHFLLDLTQPFSIIDENIANQMKLEAQKLPSGFSVFFAMQNLSKFATVTSVQFGPLPFPATEFVLWKKMDTSKMPGSNPAFKMPELDGVIGINVLARLDFELDLKGKKLGLFLPNHCPFVPDWGTGPVSAVPFQVDASWNALSIPATLDDKPIAIALDTSAKETTMTAYRASRIFGFDVFTKELEVLPKEFGVSRRHYPFKKLSAAGLTINNPRIAILGPLGRVCNDSHSAEFEYICYRRDMGDVIVGPNVIAGLHLYFSQNEKKVYFAPAGSPAASPSNSGGDAPPPKPSEPSTK